MNKRQSKQINTFVSMIEMSLFFSRVCYLNYWGFQRSNTENVMWNKNLHIPKLEKNMDMNDSLISLYYLFIGLWVSQHLKRAETFVFSIMSVWELQVTLIKVIYFNAITQKRLARKSWRNNVLIFYLLLWPP